MGGLSSARPAGTDVIFEEIARATFSLVDGGTMVATSDLVWECFCDAGKADDRLDIACAIFSPWATTLRLSPPVGILAERGVDNTDVWFENMACATLSLVDTVFRRWACALLWGLGDNVDLWFEDMACATLSLVVTGFHCWVCTPLEEIARATLSLVDVDG